MMINPTSFVVFSNDLCRVVNTGGWFDVYLNGQHYTGTASFERAAEIFQGFILTRPPG